MKLLAFDTSTAICSVAVASGGRSHASQQFGGREQHRVLFEQIEHVLRKANLTLSELDGIAFDHGPGAFIGVRITMATAQAFGYAHQLRLIGLSSLEILAQQAIKHHGANRVLATLDARKDEVYYGYYRNQDGIAMADGATGVCPLPAIPGLAEFDGIGWGNGFANDEQVRQMPITVTNNTATPTADAMLMPAIRRLTHGLGDSAQDVRPIYLRNHIANNGATHPN